MVLQRDTDTQLLRQGRRLPELVHYLLHLIQQRHLTTVQIEEETNLEHIGAELGGYVEVVRYLLRFNPPTSQFQVQSQTVSLLANLAQPLVWRARV